MKKLLFICFLFFAKLLSAQYPGEGEIVGASSKFNPIPSTPNVAAFEKYGNMPVNANTGIPQIGVPIHQISLNGFSWPIHLSYHASGFKSTDVATRNGLGWTLQAAGIISIPSSANLSQVEPDPGDLDLTFTCNGLPSTSPYCDPNNSWDMWFANAVLAGSVSSAPGIYSVNTANGISLKFMPQAGSLPASDISVGSTLMRDTEGNKYEFLAEGTNSRISVCLGMQDAANSTSNSLTKIITSKGETIEFTYDTEVYEYELPPLHIIKSLNSGQSANCNSYYVGGDYYCDNEFEAAEKRLKKIQSSTGELVYFYYSSRDDLPGSSKMDSIKIWHKSGSDSVLLKSSAFNYSYFGTGSDPDDLQLKLNEVLIKKDGISSVDTFRFKYDSTQSLPAKTDPVRLFSGLNFDRFNMSTAGVIRQIEYPTGGFTKFQFDTVARYGLLKVTKIWDSTGTDGVSNIRSFEYTLGASMVGTPEFIDYETVYYFGLPNEINCTEDSPCAVPNEWLQNCNATVWKSEPLTYPGEEYADASPRFGYIIEKFGPNGENGKIEYVYGFPSITRDVYDVMYLNAEYLLWKTNYKKNADNSYTVVSKTINEYEVPSSSNTYWGDPQHPRENRAYSRRIKVLRPEMRLPCCDCFGDEPTNCMKYFSFSPIYQEIGRRISSVPVYLKSNKEIQYSGADSILVQTNYFYDDSAYLQASRKEVVNSKGETVKTRYKFPYNFSGTAVYDSMIVRNRISAPIEIIDTNVTKSVELSRAKTNYQLWNSNTLIEPATIQKSVSGNTLETELSFQGYNYKGAVRQATGKDELVQTVIWDYNETYPVAQVIKADSNSVARTSFETDNKGGWTYSGTPNSYYAMTGKKSYQVSGGNLTKSGLASATYIVSYWGIGSANVNSAGPTRTGKTVGSWTYYEHEVTATSITVSGSSDIDELRLYPKGAMMKTYTYDPLVGMTSECDATNRIMYYEYDSSRRLKTIKDEDGRIIKRFDYKYKAAYLD